MLTVAQEPKVEFVQLQPLPLTFQLPIWREVLKNIFSRSSLALKSETAQFERGTLRCPVCRTRQLGMYRKIPLKDETSYLIIEITLK